MSLYTLSCCDSLDGLKRLQDSSVNLVIADVAYESLEKHRKVGTTTRLSMSAGSSNEWFPIFGNDRFPELFNALHRVLAKNSHFYFFCDYPTSVIATATAYSTGFTVWNPLVWNKASIGMGYHYRSKYELICFFEKGKRGLKDLSIPNVLDCPAVRGMYPTQKPQRLSDILVQQSSDEGELVLDPSIGSGTFGVSAVSHGRRFVGFDVKAEAVALADFNLHVAESGWCNR